MEICVDLAGLAGDEFRGLILEMHVVVGTEMAWEGWSGLGKRVVVLRVVLTVGV